MIKRLFFCLLLLVTTSVCSKPIKVVYIPPGHTGYWGATATPLPAVAKQLGLNLTVVPARLLKEDYLSVVRRVVKAPDKPDWIIWTQRRNDPQIILDLFQKHNIKSIDVTSGFLAYHKKKIGYPQEHYPNWIAQVMNDEFNGGKSIALELIKRKQKDAPDKPIKMIAIAGDRATKAAQSTVLGLHNAFTQNNNAELIQTVYGNWQQKNAQEMTKKLLMRHGHLDAIWTASTDLALGIITQLNDMTFTTQPKPIVASLGWKTLIFDKITTGELEFSLGGNHLNAMWALILLYDHENGFKIAPTPQDTLFATPYTKATKDNVDKIKPYLAADIWSKTDIKRFSKALNPKIKAYNFDFSLIINPAAKPQ